MSLRSITRLRPVSGPIGVLAVIVLLQAGYGRGQTATGAPRARGGAAVTTAPLKMRIWTERGRADIVVVGRTSTHLQPAPDAGGVRPPLAIADLSGVRFDLPFNRFEVMRALHQNDWAAAIRLQLPAFEPLFPYLDLPNNNAADGALALGTTMMQAARRTWREAASEADREQARRQYELAHTVFQHCSRVAWSSVGLLAQLKDCRCLIALGRLRPAYLQAARVEEPLVGDAAYGHYWLVQAELHLATNGFQSAMEAGVKSLCFEDKDIETFPDALVLSAQCYEGLGEPHRARDVYFEVAKLFPRTEWAALATARLRQILAGGRTRAAEDASAERTFLGADEDMNSLVEAFLKEQDTASVIATGEPDAARVDHGAADSD